MALRMHLTGRPQTEPPAQASLAHWSEAARAAVVELGRRALEGAEPPALMQDAVTSLVEVLHADFAAVERVLPDGPALLLAEGEGWPEGVVGHAVTAWGPDSLGALVSSSASALVIESLAGECRFTVPQVLADHDVQSGIVAAIRTGEGPYGVLGVYARNPRAFNREDANVVDAIAGVLAEAIKRKEAEAVLRKARDHERRLRERLEAHARLVVEAQEAERRRIARELHDEIGQTLTGLKLTLEGLERAPSGELAEGLGRARALVAELMSRVDILSLDLRPAMLDDLGLLPALLWLVGRYYAQTGVRVAIEHSGLERKLQPDVETAAYRIVQEALTNVARHADTGRAWVRCRAGDDSFLIEVADEGAGFDSTAAAPGTLKFGLVGMEERARLVGGTLTVTSEPGKGTTVVAKLPIRRETPA
ncbi:MAG: ATP-binding protein [Actinomycetota bacterium]